MLRLESGQLSRAWNHIAALEECDAAWDVNVEEMLLAVGGRDLALFIEAQARIVNALVSFDKLRDGTPDDVGLGLPCKLRQ